MIVGADATDDRAILADRRAAVRRLPAAGASTTPPSAHPRRGARAAAGRAAAAVARAPPLPGRLADALLRFRATARSWPSAPACCGSMSIPKLAWALAHAVVPGATSTVRRGELLLRVPRPGRQGGRPAAAGAARAPPARRRSPAPACVPVRKVLPFVVADGHRARGRGDGCFRARRACAASLAVLSAIAMQVRLDDAVDLDSFRRRARQLLADGVPPEQVSGAWRGPMAGKACSAMCPSRRSPSTAALQPCRRHRRAVDVITTAIPGASLLYRLLSWRLAHEPALRHDPLDADMMRAQRMAKAVHRDIHKMRAFVRFAQVMDERRARAPCRMDSNPSTASSRPARRLLRAPLRADALSHPHARALRRMGRPCAVVPRGRRPPREAAARCWRATLAHLLRPHLQSRAPQGRDHAARDAAPLLAQPARGPR